MKFTSVKKSQILFNNSGFTIIELLIVLFLGGILASISLPSFLGTVQRSTIDNGLVNLYGAVKETQKEAFKKSKKCQIILPPKETKNAVLGGTCLVKGKRTFNDVHITYNNSATMNFTYRGGVSPLRTIVVYIPNVNYRRCLVISDHIGIMRKGVYTNHNLSSVSAAHCHTSQS